MTQTKNPAKTKSKRRSLQKISSNQFKALVREAAYYRFIDKSEGHGHHQSDWFEAESEIAKAYQIQ